MKKLSLMFVIMAFVCSCFASVYAADVNNGLNDQYIGESKPAISGKAVDCHLRVLEFVLATRMTLAQKQAFVKAVSDESRNMTTDQIDDFMDAVGLADSLNQLSDEDAEPIRQMLEKDFNATVAALDGQNDLAAITFNRIKAAMAEKVISSKDVNVTRQSLEAFAEYLAFLANTQNPAWPNELTTNATIMRVKAGFNNYTEDEKAALEDFQLTWYLIRAAWQSATKEQRAAWQADFNKVGIKSGVDATSANIKAALSTEVYADLLDAATKAGIEPIEWSSKTTALIW